MRKLVTLIAVLASAAGATTVSAEEKLIDLAAGAGLDEVMSNCHACHSLDYIQMNSPFLNAAQWTAEVSKMIKVFGAPISDAEAKIIIDYLTKHYGS
jgi:hypothetical protein